jgi:restriction endonuclease S subunit
MEEDNNDEEKRRLRVKRAITGSVAKIAPDIYREIKKDAEELGIEPEDAIMEAYELWRLSRTFEDIDPKSFLAGYNFFAIQLRNTISFINKLGQVWVGEFMNAQANLLEQLNQQRQAVYNQLKKEVEEELAQKGSDIKQKWRDMKEIITEVTETIMKAFYPQQYTQYNVTPNKDVKVESDEG